MIYKLPSLVNQYLQNIIFSDTILKTINWVKQYSQTTIPGETLFTYYTFKWNNIYIPLSTINNILKKTTKAIYLNYHTQLYITILANYQPKWNNFGKLLSVTILVHYKKICFPSEKKIIYNIPYQHYLQFFSFLMKQHLKTIIFSETIFESYHHW